MEVVILGWAIYIFKSRVVAILVLEIRIPRLFPAPFEYTFIVDPFIELNEKLAEPNVPVPLHSIPVTIDVPVELACALLTLRTMVLNFVSFIIVFSS